MASGTSGGLHLLRVVVDWPPRSSEAAAATRQATIAKTNVSCRPWRNGPEISWGKNERPVSSAWRVRAERGQRVRAEQVLDRVVAEEGGEQDRDRRQVGGVVRPSAAGTPCASSPLLSACGSVADEPDDHQREEDPDRDHLGRVLEGLVHAAAGAAVARAAGCS